MAKTKGKRAPLKTELSVGSNPTGPTKIYELIQAFVFACFGCGKQYAAPVPEEGSIVEFQCNAEGCGYEHKMTWTGKAWKVTTPGHEQEPTQAPVNVRDDHQIAEDAVELIKKRQERSEPRPPAFGGNDAPLG